MAKRRIRLVEIKHLRGGTTHIRLCSNCGNAPGTGYSFGIESARVTNADVGGECEVCGWKEDDDDTHQRRNDNVGSNV